MTAFSLALCFLGSLAFAAFWLWLRQKNPSRHVLMASTLEVDGKKRPVIEIIAEAALVSKQVEELRTALTLAGVLRAKAKP